MGTPYQSMRVTVARIEDVTPQIKRFTLALPGGGPMPGFTGGGHVIVQMEDGSQRYSNAYSLMNSPEDRSCYQIGVRREERSKGGSAFMHDKVRAGDTLTITTPNNMFALRDEARRHILIAGGIGITPFMSQLHELRRRGAVYFAGLGHQATPALHLSAAYYRYQQSGGVTTQFQATPQWLGGGSADAVAAVADYAFSKRTSLFLEADVVRSRGGAVGRETEYWGGSPVTASGSTRFGVMLGMRQAV